jgi:hypothetical protein
MHRGLLPPDQVHRETIRSVVDSGAMKLVLPEAVVKRLGLPLGDKVKVHEVDGRKAQRREANGLFLELLGRDGTFTAISEPKNVRRPSLARLCSKTSMCWWIAWPSVIFPVIPAARFLKSSEPAPRSSAGSEDHRLSVEWPRLLAGRMPGR